MYVRQGRGPVRGCSSRDAPQWLTHTQTRSSAEPSRQELRTFVIGGGGCQWVTFLGGTVQCFGETEEDGDRQDRRLALSRMDKSPHT